MKYLSILGSTGSIGRSSLAVVQGHPHNFRVRGLAARNNVDLLGSQIRQFRPEVVAVYDEGAAEELRSGGLPVEVLSGEEGLAAVATLDGTDMVLSAISGSAGLRPTYAAVQAGKDVALATKEALVMAGRIITSEASRRGVRIVPVDSEHSAIFQCLHGRDMSEVDKIVLTASGGPFLKKDRSELASVTPGEALKHPNWNMGRKITIDSATLMNKGLEVIEACWLFGLPPERVEVILHPQSIIHSMVKFIDGSVIAHLSVPDMRGPIGYALSYPERMGEIMDTLDLAKVGELTFERPDHEKYPSLGLTYEALRQGGTMPCVLNAANEAAVDAFLDGEILFTDITRVVSQTMSEHRVTDSETIDDVVRISEWARGTAEGLIRGMKVH